MENNHKYVILGDAQSPHLIKWIKELHSYFNLYVITFNYCNSEIFNYVDKKKCFEFGVSVKQEGGNFHILKLYFKLKKLLYDINPEIVHAHYITSYGFLASLCVPKSCYLILSAWGTDILKTPFESWIKKLITIFSLRKAMLLTSDSNYMTEKIHQLYSKTNLLTFPFGISVMPEVSFNEKDSNLFFSNRALTRNYKIDKVLECFSEIKKQFPKSRLIIANKGDEEENLKNYANSLNLDKSVQWVGYLSENEQSEYYRKSQYFFSLPESDATSVSLLEAMAYGCVPIVSNIPANLEWIENRKNGIVLYKATDIISELNSIKPDHIFEINRKIIEEKAIFPKLIKDFVLFVKGQIL